MSRTRSGSGIVKSARLITEILPLCSKMRSNDSSCMSPARLLAGHGQPSTSNVIAQSIGNHDEEPDHAGSDNDADQLWLIWAVYEPVAGLDQFQPHQKGKEAAKKEEE